LLAGGGSGDTPLADAFRAGGRARDVTLRKALDGTEPQVAAAFVDSPLGEARVRELLGAAYLSVGEPDQAVKQFERALALREALQGPNQRAAAACRNQLAVAYRLAGRTAEAARLFQGAPDSAADASALAVRGSVLLREKKAAEAELKLRQALNILEKVLPDDWSTFDVKSNVGEALLEQKKYRDAEPFLVSGYEGLKQRKDQVPAQDRSRVGRALQRLVRLYDAWGKPDEAAKWRKELGTPGG
jgi:tetratricopeptide (TPR) repeat protein